MSRRWALAYFVASLPAVIGFLAWLVILWVGWLPDYVIYLRISLGYLLLGIGLLLTLLLAGFLTLAYVQERRSKRLTEEAHLEAAARRRQFLLRLDHELKNPLTTLQVEVANLEATADLDPEQGLTASRLKEQVLRLNELVIQLRKLAELETRPIEPEAVDLDELLHDLVSDFQSAPDGSQRQISLNLPQVPWPLPRVQGDPDLLYLALRNVIDNAVKFTRPGDSIQVRAFEDSHQAIIEVADTGQGIPDEEQGQVWEELFRGQMARGSSGSGLGLALVKAIIERHGGSVSLRSRLGQGTLVTLRIPTRL
jgi:two-component system OmpR family sensor kinase